MDRASSKVTWVVMAAASVFHTDGEEENDKGEFQTPPNIFFVLTLSQPLLEVERSRVTKATLKYHFLTGVFYLHL